MRLFAFYGVLMLLLCSTISQAETPSSCPSIESVHALNNIWPDGIWLPLYADTEELASEEDIINFSRAAVRFYRAEWNSDYPETGHCFYLSNNPPLKPILLAQHMLKPDINRQSKWDLSHLKRMVCNSDQENDCLFSGMG